MIRNKSNIFFRLIEVSTKKGRKTASMRVAIHFLKTFNAVNNNLNHSRYFVNNLIQSSDVLKAWLQ